MIPTLPLTVRNRLAETILAAFHDERARAELMAIARLPDDALPSAWLTPDERRHAPALLARARRAAEALAGRASGRREQGLDDVLASAATLFDAGLYFEVHEVLEPSWREAHGPEREALQGLIQVAVGYQHLANENLAGARSLLAEGAARLAGGGLPLELGPFVAGVLESLRRLPDVSEGALPRFPQARAA